MRFGALTLIFSSAFPVPHCPFPAKRNPRADPGLEKRPDSSRPYKAQSPDRAVGRAFSPTFVPIPNSAADVLQPAQRLARPDRKTPPPRTRPQAAATRPSAWIGYKVKSRPPTSCLSRRLPRRHNGSSPGLTQARGRVAWGCRLTVLGVRLR